MLISILVLVGCHITYLEGQCESDWLYNDSKCYFFSTESGNFSQSLEKCERKQSTLASIQDIKEDQFLKARVYGDDAWIGLYKKTLSGEPQRKGWEWIDGTIYSFDGWADYEPTGNAHCARLNKERGWMDRLCEIKFHYICEKGSFIDTTHRPTTKNTSSTVYSQATSRTTVENYPVTESTWTTTILKSSTTQTPFHSVEVTTQPIQPVEVTSQMATTTTTATTTTPTTFTTKTPSTQQKVVHTSAKRLTMATSQSIKISAMKTTVSHTVVPTSEHNTLSYKTTLLVDQSLNTTDSSIESNSGFVFNTQIIVACVVVSLVVIVIIAIIVSVCKGRNRVQEIGGVKDDRSIEQISSYTVVL